MELFEAKEVVAQIKGIPGYGGVGMAACVLDDRVTKLEVALKAESEAARHAISRARYTHKNRLIKQMEQRAEEKIKEALGTQSHDYELHIKELKAQRDELLDVAKAGYNLSAYAAAINWDGIKNTGAWMEGLKKHIEDYQAAYQVAIEKTEGVALEKNIK